MKTKIITSLAFLLTVLCSTAQETAPLKRSAYKLRVAVDAKTFYEEDLEAKPYILPDQTIQLYPGESIYVEMEMVQGVVKSMKVVNKITDSSRTCTIAFMQTTEKKAHQLMMLKVVNPFKQPLIYNANIYLLRQKQWSETDIYPVEPGMGGYETWPDIITSIALGDWKLK